MDKIIESGTTILMGVIGVAILAVIVSQRANTSNVLTAGGNAFASILNAATGPVSGSGFGTSLGPTGGFTGTLPGL